MLHAEGVVLVLLGQLQRAREMVKERVLSTDLTQAAGQMVAVRDQGMAKGLDLAIDLIFEIANFEEERNG